MSEGKTIIDISKELTDKTFTFSDYFIEVDTADETYKMSFETYFEGVLAPDGSGNIDANYANLDNVGNIDALGITAPSINADGNAKNSILAYISFQIVTDPTQNTLTEYSSNAIVLGTEASPPASLTNADQYLEIPYGKREQQFILLTSGYGHSFYFKLYKYNRTYFDYTAVSTRSFTTSTSKLEIFEEIWAAMQTLTSNEDLRIFYDASTSAGVSNITLQGFR